MVFLLPFSQIRVLLNKRYNISRLIVDCKVKSQKGEIFMVKVQNTRLKECRIGLNLRPEYISNLIGITSSELLNIESGTSVPEASQVRKLAEVYGCPEQYFYENDDKTTTPVLARNGNDLSPFDQQQIAEFLAFQKEISAEQPYK